MMPRAPLPRDEVVRLYEAGWSVRSIGDHFDVHGQTILNRLREWGVATRGSGDSKRGNPHSAEHRAKISEALRGKTPTPETRVKMSQKAIGRKAWNKGLRKATHPELIRYGKSGHEHWAWNGGVSPAMNRLRQSSEYKAWRDSVFSRDNYTCVFCGKRGGQLEADHIEPFSTHPELRFVVSNGRTLCEPCHRQRTREQMRVLRSRSATNQIIEHEESTI